MTEYRDYCIGVITDDNGEVVRYISITDDLLSHEDYLFDVIFLNFAKLCGKPGYYTFRVEEDFFKGQLPVEYDFWLKPEGNGLREIPLSLV